MENYIYQMDKKEEWVQDMKKSSNVFNEHIDEIKQLLETGIGPVQIMSVEAEDNEICKMLDTKAGIDYFVYRKKQDNSYSLASRILNTTKTSPPNVFTMRFERESGAKTEYQKIKNAIEHDLNYPQFTLTIYYKKDTDKILSMGLARTTDIIKCIDAGMAEEKLNDSTDKWVKYYSLRWKDMTDAGYFVKTYYAA